MNYNVIIVAGGKGLRMGNDLPKQFIPILGKPILMRSIEAFYDYNNNIRIVLVLPESYRDFWKELCSKYKFTLSHIIASGGETRFESVKNGLSFVNEGLVAIHDGVRPFVSTQLIAKCFDMAINKKAVIPVVNCVDSLREVHEKSSCVIDRNCVRFVQTPQVFQYSVISDSYKQIFNSSFSDDASVVESLGQVITLIEGEYTNIKVTTPIDLLLGELILKNSNV